MTPRPLRVAVVCPGAGRVWRGYETFAVELVTELQRRPTVVACLFQGVRVGCGQPSARGVPCLRREGRTAGALARLLGLHRCSIEHYSFGLCSVPALVRFRPDVLLVSERVLGNLYAVLRSLLRLRFRLVLSNGGAHRPPFSRFDLVHQPNPEMRRLAIDAGEPSDRHLFVPYGFAIPADPFQVVGLLRGGDRAVRRAALGLPVNCPVVLSVGALDRSRKRMDHLVREVAGTALPGTGGRPFLALLGERTDETAELEALAADMLGLDGFLLGSAEPKQLRRWYQAADVFVLASVEEGFGRVLVEAQAAGLPCIAHDSPTSRFVLGDLGVLVDMTAQEALRSALALALAGATSREVALARHARAHGQFSWDALGERYVEMLEMARFMAPAARARG